MSIEPSDSEWSIGLHVVVMLMFLQPSQEQMSIIENTDEETRQLNKEVWEIHHRDGVDYYNDLSNLQIVPHGQIN